MRLAEMFGSARRVDRYWGRHVILSEQLETAEDSLAYLEWRFDEYPLFREFSGLWGEHDDEVVLDYGCGPGNDLVGFLAHTEARRVIGVDVSTQALKVARQRLSLHDFPEERYELIQVSNAKPRLPLDDGSVDYLQCQGVLQHTSDPLSILHELNRVLKPGGEGRVMVYNRDSIWLHLYVAYTKMILEGAFAGMSVDAAFEKTTDGEDCPVAKAYRPDEFAGLCREAGFEPEFLGGYPSRHELDQLEEHRDAALSDERLDAEHREFLDELEADAEGYPMWHGRHAGVGGSFVLSKP